MKRRTTLFTLAMLLSAGFGMQAQNLSRQPLSFITLQHDPLLPQAASENTDKTGWLWKTRVKKIFYKGEWLILEKLERTFDENDRIATQTQTTFDYDRVTTECKGGERIALKFDSNGFNNHTDRFRSNDGVNFTLLAVADAEADPIFTQTWTSNHAIFFNTETNQWEEDETGNLTWWKEVKRDNEGRITEVVFHTGLKPNSTSSTVQYQFHYKDGERAPHEMVLFPNNDDKYLVKNIKWHESDGNFIWLGNTLYQLFFDGYDTNNRSKNNKPIRYEVYDKEGNRLGTNQYTYQANGGYERKTETTNWTASHNVTVLDQYGSYKETLSTIENQMYSTIHQRILYNEYGHQILYEKYERQNHDESSTNWDIYYKEQNTYNYTYENEVLTAIEMNREINNNGSINYSDPILYEFSDFHKPQTGIDNQTAANDLNVVFINNCLQLNLPVGTSYILCDIQGRVITSGNEAPEQLDLNSYTNGVYLFKVKTKDGRQQCFKLMKH